MWVDNKCVWLYENIVYNKTEIMNEENITAFCRSISNATLSKLFRRYHLGLYDHLLQNERMPTNEDEERAALRKYLRFIMNNEEEDSERQTKLAPCVQANDELKLVDLLCDDQFFEEPLVHAINTCHHLSY